MQIPNPSSIFSLFSLFRYRKSNATKMFPIGFEQSLDDEFDEAAEDESVQIDFISNGRCRALEHFSANDYPDVPALLTVEKGEELLIIQKDLGSGYTSVKGLIGSGFVPTSILYFF